MNMPNGVAKLTALYPEPQMRTLIERADAEATFARVAASLPPDFPDHDIVVTLTALAALRAREAAERSRR